MILTSWLYSRKTWKLRSFLSTGWAATRHKKTSCMATVFLKMARYSLCNNTKRGDVVINPARQTTMGTTTAVCAHSRLELLLHLCELLFSHGSLALAQLLQLLSGCIKVWSWRCWGDLQQQHTYGSTLKPAHTLSGLWCRFDNSVARACLLFC